MKGYLLNEIDKLNADQFEELLLHLFKHQGYFAKRTSDSQKYRADVLLKKGSQSIDVYMKKSSDKIVLSEVNKIIEVDGNYSVNKKWIVTNSYFTKAAKVQAQKDKVELFDRGDLVEWMNDYHLHSIRLKKNDNESSKKARSK
ncbi:restriction endonuclease [Halobacillus mangrovi]|uniref:restriction endonuclease n=1 Tax=Halobacillus mangrovi TaxID=402384 RepID=UPI003D956BF6